jgi:hypothetical protein
MGAIVEAAPSFIPGIGDASGLLADFKDYLENGDQWTAADWALVAAGLVPGAPNRKTVKAGGKIVDDLLDKHSSGDLLSQQVKKQARARTYSDLLPKQGHIFYWEGEARLLSKDPELNGESLGMIFVREKPTTKRQKDLDNQRKAPGQAYGVDDGVPYVPALRYSNKDGNDFIRFDGYEITDDGHVMLIDRKATLTDFKMIQDSYVSTLKRVRDAVTQNNKDANGGALFKVAYDFDDEAEAMKFKKFVENNGYDDVVTVRVRKTYE